MNVAILSTTHGDGFGAERILADLIQASPGGAGSALLIISPEDSLAYREAGTAGHRRIALSTAADRLIDNLVAVKRLSPQLADLDLVHAWHARGFEQASWIGKQQGIPVTGTLHDHPRAGIHGRCRQYLMRRSSAKFQRLACVSQAVADACELSGYKCPLTVVRNGLVEIPQRVERAPGPLRVGFLGMYAEWKGFAVVEDWIRQCADLDLDWHLYGPIAGSLRERANATQRSAPEKVHLEGRKPAEQIFATIDLLVAPSIEFDPLPTVLIEAARAGIACVASNGGGAAEIVDHLKSGYVFAVTEPATGLQYLRRLSEDAALRKALGRAARQKFEESFRVSRMVSAYADLWHDSVQKGGVGRCPEA